jgi:hypothetical protein
MPIAYGVKSAHLAFEPPCSMNSIAKALKKSELRAIRVGTKRYVLTSDLIEWAAKQGEYDNGR